MIRDIVRIFEFSLVPDQPMLYANGLDTELLDGVIEEKGIKFEVLESNWEGARHGLAYYKVRFIDEVPGEEKINDKIFTDLVLGLDMKEWGIIDKFLRSFNERGSLKQA